MRNVRQFIFRWRGGLIAPLVLLVLWVARPSPASLMLGALLAAMGEGIRLWAIGYTGEPTRSQQLDAPRLVTGGPYSLTRNPLYCGNLLNGVAVAVAACGGYSDAGRALLLGLVCCGLGGIYGSIIPLEEEFLEERFGEQYRHYREEVAALIPRKLKPKAGTGTFSLATALRFEKSSLLWLVAVWSVLCLKTGP